MISVVVLSHNDEASLISCLRSLSWSDEIIVVDDESSDKTIDTAKKLGAKVYVRKVNNNFARQRNFGLEKAKGEWVMFVDSDEVISEELAKEIQESLRKNSGYFIKRKDYWGGKWLVHGETGNIKLLRLAKKNAGEWVQPIHEVWNIQGSIGTLSHPLLHYPHQNVAQFLDEINRYSGVYAGYLFDRGIKEPSWQIIAKPILKFLINYFWRLGFLDGTGGMVYALMMSFHSFLVRGKLWKLWYSR